MIKLKSVRLDPKYVQNPRINTQLNEYMEELNNLYNFLK